MQKLLPVFLFIVLGYVHSAFAQNPSKENFYLKNESITHEFVKPQPSVSPSPDIEKEENGNVIVGFEEKSQKPFSFSIENRIIDYGPLSATNPVVRENTISFDPGSASNGLSIFALEDSALKNNQDIIPDTTCDNGTCDRSRSDLWQSSLTYGFGFSCRDIDEKPCEGFLKNAFKKFPSESEAEYPLKIVDVKELNAKKAKLTYKVNISSSQKEANYSNTITLIVVPNY